MAKYKFSQYKGKIGRLYVNGNRVFIGLNEEFANSAKQLGLQMRINTKKCDSFLVNDASVDLFEVDKNSKKENPILSYIFEQLSNTFEIRKVTFLAGWTSATSDAPLFTDIKSIIGYYERIL